MQAFNKLVTNIKGASDIVLAPTTAITGPNYSGKTSLIDTIRLAATGKHPVGAAASALAELAPPDTDLLYAELHSPEGALCWDMRFVDGRPRKSSGVTSQGVFADWTEAQRNSILVFDSLGTLRQTNGKFVGADLMRRAVMNRFGTLTETPRPRGLNPKQKALWDEAASAAKGDPSEQLVQIQAWLKSAVKSRGDAAKHKESVIQGIRSHTQEVGGAEQLPDLEEQLATARLAAMGADARENIESLTQECADILGRIESLESCEDMKMVIALAEQDKREAEEALTRGRALEMLMGRAEGSCPCCGTEGVDLDAIRAALQAGITRREAQVEQATRMMSEARSNMSTAEADQLRSLLKVKEASLARYRSIEAEAPEWTGPSAEELSRQIDLIKMATEFRRQLNQETEVMHRLLDEQATAKLLASEAARMLTDYVHKTKTAAEEGVNRFMPAGFAAELRVTDTVCEWRMLGADNRSHKLGAFSGSEAGALLTSLALAWSVDAPYRLLVLDDVDLGVYDPRNLHLLLAKLKTAVIGGLIDQVIVAWNRPDEIPPDWHNVRIGE